MVPIQSLTGDGLLAVVVTFLLLSAFYAVTLHLAATFFIGDVPSQRAASVGPVPAAVSILLQRYGLGGGAFGVGPSVLVGVAVAVTLVADLLAISAVYRLRLRSAIPLALLHFAFATVGGIALANLFGLL